MGGVYVFGAREEGESEFWKLALTGVYLDEIMVHEK